jgi:hypothetical protein
MERDGLGAEVKDGDVRGAVLKGMVRPCIVLKEEMNLTQG